MKKTLRKLLTLVLSAAVILSTVICAIPITAAKADPAADFMAGKYGVMLHFLPAGSSDWNQTVNDFSVEDFAKDANRAGASWVLFTLTQSDGRYCVPMTEFSDVFGGDYGVERDLVEDLYDALSPYGIKLMLYWIPGAPSGEGEIATSVAAKLGATERRNGSTGDWMLNDDVINNMSTVMTGLSKRYGEKVEGWWLDACYDGIGFNNTYAEQLANALRAGNSDAAVAFNNGTRYDDCRFEAESYAAGEICNNGTLDTVSIYDYSATSRWTENGFQKHYLTFLGTNWRSSEERYVTNELVEHAYNNILKNGGALTFDVGFGSTGKIDAEQLNQLIALNRKSNTANNLSVDFEDGNNPFAWVSNVYKEEGATWPSDHYSNDSAYVQLAYGEEALNGGTSLKVLPQEGNSRTDVIAAIPSPSDDETPVTILFNGNSDFNKADAANGFDKVSGIMMRLKLTNDGNGAHTFRFIVNQDGLAQPTNLARSAKLYATDGTYLGTAASKDAGLSGEIPASFDGFVFMPFAESRSGTIIEGVGYGNYSATPEVMVDFSKNFKVMMWLNGPDYNNSTVLMDDINFYYGNTDAAAWNTMRALGYNVLYNEQPAIYEMPINFENGEYPFNKANQIYTRTDYTKDPPVKTYPQLNATVKLTADEALTGNGSLKITNTTSAYKDNTAIYDSFARTETPYFDVKGVEGFSKEELLNLYATDIAAASAYAKMKVRIKVPGEATDEYQFRMAVKQGTGSDYYQFAHNVTAYNADGTKNTAVTGHDVQCWIPGGFDGYIYFDVYNLRVAGKWTGAYTNSDYAEAAPDFSKDFKLMFDFGGTNWEGQSVIIDEIDMVLADDGKMPYTFDEYVYSKPTFRAINNGNWGFCDVNKYLLYTNAENALNGNKSLFIDLQSDCEHISEKRHAISYVEVKMQPNTNNATGLMIRIKVEDETPLDTLYEGFGLSLSQNLLNSSSVEMIIGGSNTKMYYADGTPYTPVSVGAYGTRKIPAGFDGFMFFPFDTYSNRQPAYSGAIDTTIDYYANIMFYGASTWQDVNVTVDDLAYYTVSDANAGLTDADAWNAIKDLGYKVYKAEQPASYTLPLDFEGCEIPFSTLSTVYNKNTVVPGYAEWHQEKSNAALATGKDALNGDVSLKLQFKTNAALKEAGVTVARGVTSASTIKGIEGLDREFLSKVNINDGFLKLRIKTPATSGTFTFRVVLSQDGLSHTTNFGNGAFGYTVDGVYTAISTQDLNCFLPGGFDGTVYMPISRAVADPAISAGVRARYSTMPEKMVDLTKEFNMSLEFWSEKAADNTFIIDDIGFELTATPGDINGDDVADTSDLIVMKKQLLGVDSTYADKCDLNGDKVVNVLDFIRLKKSIG